MSLSAAAPSPATAEDLSATILSATPANLPSVSAAISATSAFLCRHAAGELSRPFFSSAFPSLLLRLFGFSSPPAWIDLAARDSHLASSLFSLLSPSGPLFSAISLADRHALLQYTFPVERLPSWLRLLVSMPSTQPLSDLSPLLPGRLTAAGELRVSIFEYFFLWFTFYPLSRPNPDAPVDSISSTSRCSRIESWVSSLASSRKPGKKPEPSLYLKLLHAYLCVFVPKLGAGAHQPHRSALLHHTLNDDDVAAFARAEFVVHALVQFWLVDNDFLPLPIHLGRAFGLGSAPRVATAEAAPMPGVAKEVNLLVKYLNCGEGGDLGIDLFMVNGNNMVGSWNSVIRRPLYRYILRTLLFCPMGASMENAETVLFVWLSYMQPWKTTAEDFLEFEMFKEKKSQRMEGMDTCKEVTMLYTHAWESYVTFNYLFYSSLVVHFLGFAHKFLHTNVQSVIHMMSKVLGVLCSSLDLLNLLQKVDALYHSKPESSSSFSNNLHKYIPSIREELQDWEAGLSESDADGSFLHENWNRDLKLFSKDEDGGYNLLQLFVLRAEHEIQILPGDLSQNIHILDAIRSQAVKLFGGQIENTSILSEVHLELQPGRCEVFTPRKQVAGKNRWVEVQKQKEGEASKRSFTDTVLGCLARILVRSSNWLNALVGLDGSNESTTYTEVGCNEVMVSGTVRERKEVLLRVGSLLFSWLTRMYQAFAEFMRAHKMTIYLKVLASKKIILTFIVLYFAATSSIRWLFSTTFAAACREV